MVYRLFFCVSSSPLYFAAYEFAPLSQLVVSPNGGQRRTVTHAHVRCTTYLLECKDDNIHNYGTIHTQYYGTPGGGGGGKVFMECAMERTGPKAGGGGGGGSGWEAGPLPLALGKGGVAEPVEEK